MKCPNCGGVYGDNCRFCGACGTPLEYEKKGSHRVPIIIMVLLSVLGLTLFLATGGQTAPSGGVADADCFTISGGTVYFDETLYTGGSTLTVPDTVDGQTVTRIGDSCFEDCDDLIAIILPDTVTNIGVEAFADCDSLRAVDFPVGLTSIGTDAFVSCDALEAVNIPSTVGYIGWDAFYQCDRLSFVFYGGTIEEWYALYHQELGLKTQICCEDGNYWYSDGDAAA